MKRIAAIIACAVGLLTVFGQIASGAKTAKFSCCAQAAAGESSSSSQGAGTADKTGTPTYTDVATIIAKYHCTVCRGAVEPRAGRSLDTLKGMLKGGKKGPVIKPGAPDQSELVRRIKGTSEPRMPISGPPWLSEAEVATIERWIKAGAPEGKP